MKRIPEPEISSSVFHATLVGGHFTLDVRFQVHQSHIHGGSLVESVPKLELSAPEAVTLPQGTDSDKEAVDMSCSNQQMDLSAQKTFGKIDDMIAHSSLSTDMTSEEGDKKGLILCLTLKRGGEKGVGPFCKSTVPCPSNRFGRCNGVRHGEWGGVLQEDGFGREGVLRRSSS
ncbi:hypothetical protein AVEN_225594-1 [Araneus ventricosus]|uniref:Uncharacterized protein n=1 Tax=Araneus ventricosus TaxID=182803 RepID=A0A4Y2EZU5_ARAVE|nr:hypothetical protein AVEN_225594-1 [Araneus ventricosus]